MEKTTRVIYIGPQAHGFVCVSLENGESFQTGSADLLCRDIRVGDTITYSPDTHTPRVHLEQRPFESVPYQA